jgi:hypothetical protein
MTQDLIPVRREDVALLLNPPAGMDYAVDAAISDATDRLSAALSAPPSTEPVGWTFETMPATLAQGMAEYMYPHQNEAHGIIVPLYTHHLPSGEAAELSWGGDQTLWLGAVQIGMVNYNSGLTAWQWRLGQGDPVPAESNESAVSELESAARAWLSPSLSETTKDQAQPDLALQERGQVIQKVTDAEQLRINRVAQWLDDYDRESAQDLEDNEMAKVDAEVEFRRDDIRALLSVIKRYASPQVQQSEGVWRPIEKHSDGSFELPADHPFVKAMSQPLSERTKAELRAIDLMLYEGVKSGEFRVGSASPPTKEDQ